MHIIAIVKTIAYHISCITKKSNKMFCTYSWFQISAYMNFDGCLLRQKQRVHVSFYFFFLSKRGTPNIFCLFWLRLFFLVCSKEDKKLLDSNKLKYFAKNWGGGAALCCSYAKTTHWRPRTFFLPSQLFEFKYCIEKNLEKNPEKCNLSLLIIAPSCLPLYIWEGKIIKTKLLTKSKTEKIFIEKEAQGT